jgi:hypothetical protein
MEVPMTTADSLGGSKFNRGADADTSDPVRDSTDTWLLAVVA